MNHNAYIDEYFQVASTIIQRVDRKAVADLLRCLIDLRARGGRLFILGVGGSAANASHAVNDFRKIAGIEAYTPTDNVSELTARINDEGWESVFVEWLKGSGMSANDALFIFSVGGGDLERNISVNLVRALDHAKNVGAMRLGIVGRTGGYTGKVANVCVIVPPVDPEMITPQTEAFQAVVWHLLVSHPALRTHEMKWESTKRKPDSK
ncbi:sugar isomerase [bacterium CG2_30_54_10]|nr:MAG: sugar isomerase [bacterium CG2_30_54_10]